MGPQTGGDCRYNRDYICHRRRLRCSNIRGCFTPGRSGRDGGHEKTADRCGKQRQNPSSNGTQHRQALNQKWDPANPGRRMKCADVKVVTLIVLEIALAVLLFGFCSVPAHGESLEKGCAVEA